MSRSSALPYEPIAPRGHLPGDGLGRIAGQVIAQVEQFAAGTGPAEAVNARRHQQVVPFLRGRLSRPPRQHGQHRIGDDGMDEVDVIEKALPVGDLNADALEAGQAGRAAADPIANLYRPAGTEGPLRRGRAV